MEAAPQLVQRLQELLPLVGVFCVCEARALPLSYVPLSIFCVFVTNTAAAK